MTLAKRVAAVAAAGLLVAEPCVAADDSVRLSERRTSAFAGLSVRVPLGGAKAARPSARLQLTTAYDVRDLRTGSVRSYKAQGLEIGAAPTGAPTLYLNGRNAAEMREKLPLSGSTSDAVWIALSVALVAVAVLVVSTTPDFPDANGN